MIRVLICTQNLFGLPLEKKDRDTPPNCMQHRNDDSSCIKGKSNTDGKAIEHQHSVPEKMLIGCNCLKYNQIPHPPPTPSS